MMKMVILYIQNISFRFEIHWALLNTDILSGGKYTRYLFFCYVILSLHGLNNQSINGSSYRTYIVVTLLFQYLITTFYTCMSLVIYE